MAAGLGREQFPNDVLLARLLRSAKRCAGKPWIHDHAGFEKSYEELFADILRTRDLIRERLPPSAFSERGILKEEAPYIAVLTRSGYEFIVAFWVARALGGACIPLGAGILPEEAQCFIQSAKAGCILAGRDCLDRAELTATLVKENGNAKFVAIPISCDADPLGEINVEINESIKMDDGGPGLVIFTSGTTGPPKGGVLPRRCLVFLPDAEPDSQGLCFRPPHWLGGTISLIEPLITGRQIHILRERASVGDIWQVLRSNRITGAGWTPGVLREMKDWVEAQSEEEQEAYLASFRQLGVIYCAGAMVSPSVVRFWKNRTKLPFQNVYGLTEVGGFATMKMLDGTEVSNSIGTAFPGAQVKLSEGDHGEICVKSPFMISHYIGDEERTTAAFDEEGYFKTGDLAELKAGEYFFAGRANTDYILFRGYRIAAVQVEVALTSLPYVSEASVMGVPDHEAKEICGAVIRLTREQEKLQEHGSSAERITLSELRSDLSNADIPKYMQPVLLKILGPDDPMPQTVSNKPIKKQIIKQCFGVEEYWSVEKPTPGVEFCGNDPLEMANDTKPWDWLGLQRGDFQSQAQAI